MNYIYICVTIRIVCITLVYNRTFSYVLFVDKVVPKNFPSVNTKHVTNVYSHILAYATFTFR